ncbi:uncharacterized protein LOC108664854 [Hyalella azteca]|uniref:Uncharacterized protein LOC108664854 n=1 Tax=Hyalella azteca TaxID=294128 RepID=A0A8B7MZQ3_HYAAZ|nr:uncharacterized protein LOC108664854 [Hyalella azteca]
MHSVMKCLCVALLLAFASSVKAQDRADEDLRLIAARVTQTAIILSTTTTVVPSTCALTVNAAICGGGRRRRSVKGLSVHDASSKSDSTLDGSISDVVENESNVDGGDAKLQVTLWTQVSSTFIVTATSTNAATKFSVSFQCSLPGVQFPAKCT